MKTNFRFSPWDAGLLLLLGFALGVGICYLSSVAFPS